MPFTSFVEPLITKKKFNPKELITSVLVVVGIIIIINNFNFSENETYLSAIVFSLLAALLAALFSIYNSVFVKEHHSGVISFYELFGGFVFISLLFLLSGDIVVANFILPWNSFRAVFAWDHMYILCLFNGYMLYICSCIHSKFIVNQSPYMPLY